MRKGSEQMARRLKEERHGSWASTWENPTWESCSVAGASPTSFSQSVTPFPLGLWGCTLLPASLCPELLWGVPQLSRGALLPHSKGKRNTEIDFKISPGTDKSPWFLQINLLGPIIKHKSNEVCGHFLSKQKFYMYWSECSSKISSSSCSHITACNLEILMREQAEQ